MFASILLLHAVGFGIFIAFVVPGHFKGLGIGVSVLAYTLGLRHAFDADHISAIDNTTRKLMNDRRGTRTSRRPLSVGYFSRLATRPSSSRSVRGSCSPRRLCSTPFRIEDLASSNSVDFGTIVSASFLYLIALLNIVILAGIVKVFRAMRHGSYDESELERQLNNRGLMFRFFGRWMRSITKEWQMYPVGVVFGMGFDTAPRSPYSPRPRCLPPRALPWYSIMCLPILSRQGCRYSTRWTDAS